MRYKTGRILLDFASPLGEGINNKAEIEAAVFKMTCALELGYLKILLEVYSKLLVYLIMQKLIP